MARGTEVAFGEASRASRSVCRYLGVELVGPNTASIADSDGLKLALAHDPLAAATITSAATESGRTSVLRTMS